MQSEALAATEAECAKGRTAPRVSLVDLENNIVSEFYFTAAQAVNATMRDGTLLADDNRTLVPDRFGVLTICLLATRNGFTLVGQSAPADAANFNPELGRKLAYEDAANQLWPLMGYALREKLHGDNLVYRGPSIIGRNTDD